MTHTSSPSKPKTWSLDLLRSIEWKRFEELCAAYFRHVGYVAKTQSHGADGGVDIRLFESEYTSQFAIAQCKAWSSIDVDVKPIRELIGVMAIEKVARAYFLATGSFSRMARTTADGAGIELIDGESFLGRIQMLPDAVQASLLAVATEGDYRTPTCVSCGRKMVERSSSMGSFWGCPNYPRCRNKIRRKSVAGRYGVDEQADWAALGMGEEPVSSERPMMALPDERPSQYIKARNAHTSKPKRTLTATIGMGLLRFALPFVILLAFIHIISGSFERLQERLGQSRTSANTVTTTDINKATPNATTPSSTIIRPRRLSAEEERQTFVKQRALEAYLKSKAVGDCEDDAEWNATVACVNRRIRVTKDFEALWKQGDPSVMMSGQ